MHNQKKKRWLYSSYVFLFVLIREEDLRQGRGALEHIDRRTNSDDSLMEYGEGDEIEFNEDGSFIGEYTGVSRRNIDRSPYRDSSEPTSPVAIYSFA